MFGIGSTELLVILVVALIALGPKSLASVSRSLGKAMGEFRRVSTDFQRAVNLEAAADEARQAEARRRQEAVQANAAPRGAAAAQSESPKGDALDPPPDSPIAQAIAKAKAEAEQRGKAAQADGSAHGA